jgi:hypothetical protein
MLIPPSSNFSPFYPNSSDFFPFLDNFSGSITKIGIMDERAVLNRAFRLSLPSAEVSYLSGAFNFPLTSSLPFSRLLLKPRPSTRRGGVATNKERLLPRLRAETSALMRRPKFSTEGVNSQADEGEHYGVQARRRDGEAAG